MTSKHPQVDPKEGNQCATSRNFDPYDVLTPADATSNLQSDLVHVSDGYVRNQKLWALCNAADGSSARNFINELDASDLRRRINRGAHLLYFGDIQDTGALAMDYEPYAQWSQTQSGILALLAKRDYDTGVPASRRAMDLYTLLDFIIVRRSRLRNQLQAVLDDAVQQLWLSNDVPISARIRIVNQAAVATSYPLQGSNLKGDG